MEDRVEVCSLSRQMMFQSVFTPLQGERQDDATVLGLLEITAQQVGNRPEESGRLGMVFRVHATAP